MREPRSRQASISIGSIESEQTALAVAPAGPSGPEAVDDGHSGGQHSHRCAEAGWVGETHGCWGQYDARRVRPLIAIALAVVAALALAACGFGEEGISVSKDDPDYNGAVLFATHCCGCHTLSAAGTQGTGNRERAHAGAEPRPANRDL